MWPPPNPGPPGSCRPRSTHDQPRHDPLDGQQQPPAHRRAVRPAAHLLGDLDRRPRQPPGDLRPALPGPLPRPRERALARAGRTGRGLPRRGRDRVEPGRRVAGRPAGAAVGDRPRPVARGAGAPRAGGRADHPPGRGGCPGRRAVLGPGPPGAERPRRGRRRARAARPRLLPRLLGAQPGLLGRDAHGRGPQPVRLRLAVRRGRGGHAAVRPARGGARASYAARPPPRRTRLARGWWPRWSATRGP